MILPCLTWCYLGSVVVQFVMEKITQKSTFPKRNVGFHPSFSRHGITRASSVLLIWLNENVHKRATTSPLFREKYVPLQWKSATCWKRLAAPLGEKARNGAFPTQIHTISLFMLLLEGLRINNHEVAPYIFLGIILFTFLLYCLPLIYRFLKSKKNHTSMKPGSPKETCMEEHDRAFLGEKTPKT